MKLKNLFFLLLSLTLTVKNTKSGKSIEEKITHTDVNQDKKKVKFSLVIEFYEEDVSSKDLLTLVQNRINFHTVPGQDVPTFLQDMRISIEEILVASENLSFSKQIFELRIE